MSVAWAAVIGVIRAVTLIPRGVEESAHPAPFALHEHQVLLRCDANDADVLDAGPAISINDEIARLGNSYRLVAIVVNDHVQIFIAAHPVMTVCEHPAK